MWHVVMEYEHDDHIEHEVKASFSSLEEAFTFTQAKYDMDKEDFEDRDGDGKVFVQKEAMDCRGMVLFIAFKKGKEL